VEIQFTSDLLKRWAFRRKKGSKTFIRSRLYLLSGKDSKKLLRINKFKQRLKKKMQKRLLSIVCNFLKFFT